MPELHPQLWAKPADRPRIRILSPARVRDLGTGSNDLQVPSPQGSSQFCCRRGDTVSTQPSSQDFLCWFHWMPRQPIEQVRYSEKFRWEKGSFDPIVHALAQYYKVKPRWGFISAFSGGVDGRHALTHSSLVRHYMDHCGTWKSSVRLILGVVQEIDIQPIFDPRTLIRSSDTSADGGGKRCHLGCCLRSALRPSRIRMARGSRARDVGERRCKRWIV